MCTVLQSNLWCSSSGVRSTMRKRCCRSSLSGPSKDGRCVCMMLYRCYCCHADVTSPWLLCTSQVSINKCDDERCVWQNCFVTETWNKTLNVFNVLVWCMRASLGDFISHRSLYCSAWSQKAVKWCQYCKMYSHRIALVLTTWQPLKNEAEIGSANNYSILNGHLKMFQKQGNCHKAPY